LTLDPLWRPLRQGCQARRLEAANCVRRRTPRFRGRIAERGRLLPCTEPEADQAVASNTVGSVNEERGASGGNGTRARGSTSPRCPEPVEERDALRTEGTTSVAPRRAAELKFGPTCWSSALRAGVRPYVLKFGSPYFHDWWHDNPFRNAAGGRGRAQTGARFGKLTMP
jgi:hypothetical protein